MKNNINRHVGINKLFRIVEHSSTLQSEIIANTIKPTMSANSIILTTYDKIIHTMFLVDIVFLFFSG